MKRHLILLFSLVAVVAAAQGIPHNMVSRHTTVNTNLIGAVVGEGLTLTNGVLSSTGGGGSDAGAVTKIITAGGYTITNEVRFADADGDRLTIWRNNNGDKEIYARDMSLTYRSEYNYLAFKNTDLWLDSWELLYGGLQSLPDYIDEKLAPYVTDADIAEDIEAATNGMVRKTGDFMTGPLTFNDGTVADPQSAFPVTVSGSADGGGTGGLRWNAGGGFNGHFAPVAGLFWEFYFRNRWFSLPFEKGGITNTAPAEIAVMKDLEDAGLTNALGSAAYKDANEFATAADEALVYQLITNRLSGVTFDFATVAGLYLAISNIVAAQGGAITNFPAIP